MTKMRWKPDRQSSSKDKMKAINGIADIGKYIDSHLDFGSMFCVLKSYFFLNLI